MDAASTESLQNWVFLGFFSGRSKVYVKIYPSIDHSHAPRCSSNPCVILLRRETHIALNQYTVRVVLTLDITGLVLASCRRGVFA